MHEKAHLDATAKQANALVQHLHVHANSRRALEVSLLFLRRQRHEAGNVALTIVVNFSIIARKMTCSTRRCTTIRIGLCARVRVRLIPAALGLVMIMVYSKLRPLRNRDFRPD